MTQCTKQFFALQREVEETWRDNVRAHGKIAGYDAAQQQIQQPLNTEYYSGVRNNTMSWDQVVKLYPTVKTCLDTGELQNIDCAKEQLHEMSLLAGMDSMVDIQARAKACAQAVFAGVNSTGETADVQLLHCYHAMQKEAETLLQDAANSVENCLSY